MKTPRIFQLIVIAIVLTVCLGHNTPSQAAAIGSGGNQIAQPADPTQIIQPPTPGVWYDRATVSFGLDQHAAASDGTYLYVIGGDMYNNGSFSDLAKLQRYSPVTNSWTQLADLPDGGSLFGAACYMNGSIYYAGGKASGTPTAAMRYYTIASNTWTSGPNYATAFTGGVAVCDAAHNLVFVIGGYDGSSYLNLTRVYYPPTNTWLANFAPLPAARENGAAGMLTHGRIIYAGGLNNGSADAAAYIYSMADNSWSNAAPMPNARASAAYGVGTDGKLYIAAGRATSNDSRLIAYSPITDSWSDGADLPHAVGDTAGAMVGRNFYVAGGKNDSDANCVGVSYHKVCNYTQHLDTDCPNVFTDLGGNIFYGAIHNLSCRGVVNGTGPTTFGPAGTSTRAQFAKVVTLGFGVPLANPQTPSFTDVPTNNFAYQFIEGGKAANILGGYSQAQCEAAGAVYPCFLPAKFITRAELTSLVVKAAGYTLISPAQPSFSDVPTNYFAYSAIETAYAKGVINGTGNGQFSPNVNIRRDQMCQIVYKGITTF